jgi:hypothetical protein
MNSVRPSVAQDIPFFKCRVQLGARPIHGFSVAVWIRTATSARRDAADSGWTARFAPRFVGGADPKNVLEDAAHRDLTFGEILAKLKVSMTGSDADFIVKLIDVYPPDHPNYEHNPDNIVMGGYQQLVRSEVFRGRFRNSFEHPEPFVPGEVSDVNFRLQDVLHTFKPGHQIMIQIHSTWFPYIDRNPQKYVDNIYEADESDFIRSTIRVHGGSSVVAGGTVAEPAPVSLPLEGAIKD